MAALTVEPLPVLMVEHLKVLMVEHLKVRVYLLGGGLMVEPACASLTVEPAYASSDGGPYGRAPKGPYQSST